MEYKIRFPHEPSMVEKLGEAYWTETFTDADMVDMQAEAVEDRLTKFIFDDINFDLTYIKTTKKNAQVYWAERQWY